MKRKESYIIISAFLFMSFVKCTPIGNNSELTGEYMMIETIPESSTEVEIDGLLLIYSHTQIHKNIFFFNSGYKAFLIVCMKNDELSSEERFWLPVGGEYIYRDYKFKAIDIYKDETIVVDKEMTGADGEYVLILGIDRMEETED